MTGTEILGGLVIVAVSLVIGLLLDRLIRGRQ